MSWCLSHDPWRLILEVKFQAWILPVKSFVSKLRAGLYETMLWNEPLAHLSIPKAPIPTYSRGHHSYSSFDCPFSSLWDMSTGETSKLTEPQGQAQWNRKRWWLNGKEPRCQSRRCEFNPLGRADSLEKEMEIYSSLLAWEMPWTEEPGGLQSKGLQRVQHTEQLSARACTHTHTHTHTQIFSSSVSSSLETHVHPVV